MSTQGTRFKIGGKVYRGQSLEDITLDDLIVFDSQAAEAGFDVSFDDLEALADKDEALTTREKSILTAVMVWLMRRAAGEDVTLKDAARTKFAQIEQLAAPGDKKAPKARKKSSGRKASAPAAEPAEPDSEAPETSSPTSASA